MTAGELVAALRDVDPDTPVSVDESVDGWAGGVHHWHLVAVEAFPHHVVLRTDR